MTGLIVAVAVLVAIAAWCRALMLQSDAEAQAEVDRTKYLVDLLSRYDFAEDRFTRGSSRDQHRTRSTTVG
jgi:hypothetical protein